MLISQMFSTGEVLEVGLNSLDGQTLVPKTRVQAEFLIQRTDSLQAPVEVNSGIPRSPYAPQTNGFVNANDNQPIAVRTMFNSVDVVVKRNANLLVEMHHC